MEIGADIVRVIIESRNTNPVKNDRSLVSTAVKEAEHILSLENSISIRTLLVHEQCQRSGVKCDEAMPIELWTLRICRHNFESSSKILDPLFLKNAIRSHLYFSQLNSWMTSNGGKLPNDLVFVYRLECDSSNMSIYCHINGGIQIEDDLTEKHVFPTVKYGLSSLLTVSLRWKKFFVPPLLRNCSSFRKNCCESIHEWISPPESAKSDIYCNSVDDAASPVSPVTPNADRFGTDDDEDSSGVFSASNSSSDSTLDIYEGPDCYDEMAASLPFHSNAHFSSHSLPKKASFFDSAVTELERLTKKRSHLTEGASGSYNRNTTKGRLFNGREDCSAAKKVKSAEVESLANAMAESSSFAKGNDQAVCSRLMSRRQSIPRRYRILSSFRFIPNSSTVFSKKTGLPLNSSPAPFYRKGRKSKCSSLANVETDGEGGEGGDNETMNGVEKFTLEKIMSTNTGLLCNFEESILNGRLEPLAAVRGFRLQITASGSFCAPHLTLPVEAFFFSLSDDNAPSPNFGRCSLASIGRKGYHIPKKGVIQATLFNPQGTVVCLFVVRYDVTEMPPFCQTFLRQRQFFMPPECPYNEVNRSWLRYLIHLGLATDRRCRVYIHNDIRMLFSQKSDLDAVNTELDRTENRYELRAFTEMPQKPQFSPRK